MKATARATVSGPTKRRRDGAAPATRIGRADMALFVAAFFFGTTFVVVQGAVGRADVMAFLGIRFTLATVVLGAVIYLRNRSTRRRGGTVVHRQSTHEWRDGLAAGAMLLLAYVLQTAGLQHTTASVSAFLTYLLVLFVPVLGFVVLGRRPHPAIMASVAVALVGLLVLTSAGSEGIALGWGEVLTLGCAIGFAAHIVLLGEVAAHHDPVRFTCIQLLTVAVACIGWTGVVSIVSGDQTLGGTLDRRVLAAAAFTGVFATALSFLAQVWAQRVVAPTRAALVLMMEPVFAVWVDWATGGDMTVATLAGGALILVAVAMAEIVPARLRREVDHLQANT